MADEAFDGVCLALDEQTAFGSINTTVRDLSGSISSTDGIVLGDRNSGDAESGVALPSIVPVVREIAAVGGSFTESADSFIRAATEGFGITFAVQGNGATATPSAGEAKPFLGIDAIFESLGFTGANGTAPVYEYTPRTTQVIIYTTVKLWHGDLSFCWQDCLIESADFVFTPGGNCLCTANIKTGALAEAADGVAFPTCDYTTQKTLAAPTIEGVNFTWGQVRGFESFTLRVANTINDYGDSNVATTGIREAQSRRILSATGKLYVNTSDSDYAYQNLIKTTAPTDDLSFQVGDVAGATDTINAFKVELNNVQGKGVKYDRIGQVLVVNISDAKGTGATAGTEAKITFN